ncbi:transposase [Macrococcoides canis]|nr:transposase [Macrococcus canis]
MEALVSDLTYVKVAGQWHYICLFIDLFNREIVGYSAGKNKDANLVSKAISRISHNLEQIELFHTDRGKEFDNHLIDEVLEAFKIKRSLSTKGCPYDNAVAEAPMTDTRLYFFMIRPIFRLDTVRPWSFKLFLIRLVPKLFLFELNLSIIIFSNSKSSFFLAQLVDCLKDVCL